MITFHRRKCVRIWFNCYICQNFDSTLCSCESIYHYERVYSLFCCHTTLLRVVVNGIFKERRDVRTACCVYSIRRQQSELRHWRTHAG